MKFRSNKENLLVEADHSAVIKCVLIVYGHANVADDIFCKLWAT